MDKKKRLNGAGRFIWTSGPSFTGLLVVFIMFILIAISPWITCYRGAITMLNHLIFFGETSRWFGLMLTQGCIDCFLAFGTVLVLIILLFLFAIRDKLFISGLMSITSGLLLIYIFYVVQTRGLIWNLINSWREGAGGGSIYLPPYNLSIAPYLLIIMGMIFVFAHSYFARAPN